MVLGTRGHITLDYTKIWLNQGPGSEANWYPVTRHGKILEPATRDNMAYLSHNTQLFTQSFHRTFPKLENNKYSCKKTRKDSYQTQVGAYSILVPDLVNFSSQSSMSMTILPLIDDYCFWRMNHPEQRCDLVYCLWVCQETYSPYS